jgi:hypothetical protein
MRLPCESFNETAHPGAAEEPEEATMNIFKGLLFLHGHINPADYADFADGEPRREYGARTAADDLAAPLGNRAASSSWLGRAGAETPQGCIVGGCG